MDGSEHAALGLDARFSSAYTRRAFLRLAGRAAATGSVAGVLAPLVGCGDEPSPADPLPQTVPPRRIVLTASGGNDLGRIQEALLEMRAQGGGEVVLDGDGTFRLEGADLLVPTSVALVGERDGAERTRIEIPTLNRVLLASDAHLRGLHLRGPGRDYVTRQEDRGRVVAGVDSGGRMDPGNGDLLDWVEGWTIEDCRIEEFTGAGVNTGMAVRGARVRGSEIENNGNAGLQIGLSCTAMRVEGNRFAGNGTNGIDCNGSDCQLLSNECHDNGWNRMWDEGEVLSSDRNGILVLAAPYSGSSGVRIYPARNVQVRGNRCSGNGRAGILFAALAPDPSISVVLDAARIEGNETYRNGATGILCEAHLQATCRDALVRGNRSYQNGTDPDGSAWGFAVIGDGMPGLRLEDNVLVGNKTGCYLVNEQVIMGGNLC